MTRNALQFEPVPPSLSASVEERDEGERVLKEMVLARERFAEEVRDTAGVEGQDLKLEGSLRARLVADQWVDPELGPIALKVLAASRRKAEE